MIKIGQARWRPTWIMSGRKGVRIRGHIWYFRLKGDNGLYDRDEVLSGDCFLVRWQPSSLPGSSSPFLNEKGKPGNLFAKFESCLAFFRYMVDLDPEECTFNEIIVGDASQRARFDLDMSREDLLVLTGREDLEAAGLEIIEQLQDSTEAVLLDLGLVVNRTSDFTICSSNGRDKQSYHLICNGFMNHDNRDARLFCERVVEHIIATGKGWMRPFIDEGVYSSISYLRLLFSRKPLEDRWKILDERWPTTWEPRYDAAPIRLKRLIQFHRTVITSTVGAQWIPLVAPTVEQADFVPAEGQVKEAMDLLDLCMPGHGFEYDYDIGSFIRLKRTFPSLCPICDEVHEGENPFIRLGKEGSFPTWYCRRNKQKRGWPLILRGRDQPPKPEPEPAARTLKPKTFSLEPAPPTHMYGKPAAYWKDMGMSSIGKLPLQKDTGRTTPQKDTGKPLSQQDIGRTTSQKDTGRTTSQKDIGRTTSQKDWLTRKTTPTSPWPALDKGAAKDWLGKGAAKDWLSQGETQPRSFKPPSRTLSAR